MYRCSWLLVVLTFAVSFLQGQAHYNASVYLKTYRQAEKWYHAENPTALSDSLAINAYLRTLLQMKKEGVVNRLTIDSYLKSGILQMTAGDNATALKSFQQAITVHYLTGQLPDSLLFQPCLYAGSIHYDFNNLDSAVFYYKKAEAINSIYPAL
ncbi:MAG: hypothetical protein ABJB05_16245, partial [Parafilimonas sp.]